MIGLQYQIGTKQIQGNTKQVKNTANRVSQSYSLPADSVSFKHNLKPNIFDQKTNPLLKTQRLQFLGGNNFNTELGCNYNPTTKKLNFGVYSSKAERIELCLYKKPILNNSEQELVRIPLDKPKNNQGIWTAEISAKDLKDKYKIDVEAGNPVYYGYRAWGPNWKYSPNWKPCDDYDNEKSLERSKEGFISHVDNDGNRFNPNKLLTDPYAKEITHDPVSPELQKVIDNTIYATGELDYYKDSGPLGPKSIFVLNKDKTDYGNKPTTALKDDVIYETHVKALTARFKDFEHFKKLFEDKYDEKELKQRYERIDKLRGTYAGAAEMAPYLKQLGVTMIELLPVQESQNDQNEMEPNNQNFWGYMPLSYFAPDRRWANDKTPGGPTREFKQMVKAFHDNGIKVCMDVVYNHTGEGGIWHNDPNATALNSLRGLDNTAYYETTADRKFYYDNTGCGANLNVTNPAAKNLVIDSLKYWKDEMGVDAFRFDLASVLGNTVEKGGFNFDSNKPDGLIPQIAEKLGARHKEKGGDGVDLIAEPWGIGDGTYQVGNFHYKWGEWNDKFRDTVRLFLNKLNITNITPGNMANIIAGSKDWFGGENTRSINFVNAHDGFTMYDIFKYNQKNNGRSDGGVDNNISWDQDGDVHQQKKAVRNAMSLLMLSNGTPMICGGDERLRTTNGNNNPYNQDKPASFIDWAPSKDRDAMYQFTKSIIKFRNSHLSTHPGKYFDGKDHNGNQLKDITWLKPDGKEADSAYMNNHDHHFLAYRVDCTEFEGEKATSIYVASNGFHTDNNKVTLPENMPGKKWYQLADTSLEESNFKDEDKLTEKDAVKQRTFKSPARSIQIFIEK